MSIRQKGFHEPVSSPFSHRDPLFVTDADLELAEQRREIIEGLSPRPSSTEKLAAAESFGVGVRQFDRYRAEYAKAPYLTTLLPGQSDGGRGKIRLSEEHRRIFDETVLKWDRERPEAPHLAVLNAARRAQKAHGLEPASVNTLSDWLAGTSRRERVRAKYGSKVAREQFEPIKGSTPPTQFPLQRVQMDHTIVDVVTADDRDRLAVGRPWITVALDEHTRACLGYVLTWEYPCASVVATLLTRVMLPKDDWLKRIGCQNDWPMFGVPGRIYTDNAAEFRSRALLAGCREWNIKPERRPKGQPHFGGIIERFIGTLMAEMKLLPGTTARNRWYGRKITRDPHEQATMTLGELDRWLAEFITGEYHKRPHGSTGKRPDLEWRRGVEGTKSSLGIGHPEIIQDRKKLFLDFSDYDLRTVQQYGVQWENERYWHEGLREFLDAGDTRKFVVRRHPLESSRIYLLHPDTGVYLELLTTKIGEAGGTVSDLKMRNRRRREGRDPSDDEARAQSADKRDAIVAGAVSERRKASRRRAREKRDEGARLVAEVRPGPIGAADHRAPTAAPSIFIRTGRQPLRIEE